MSDPHPSRTTDNLARLVTREAKTWDRDMILQLVVLALTIFVAHYFHFRFLGLYEDDYNRISRPLAWDLSNFLIASLDRFVEWPLGRPMGYFLPGMLAFLGGKLGGLSAAYIIAYLVHATNATLFYFLLRRIGLASVALIGAITFGLFPADTTHILLMHAFGLHTSLTFFLIASHCYLSGRKTLAHALSLGSLLTYESPYMLFLAVPLLTRNWDKNLVREIIRHVAVWLGIVLVVLTIRVFLGEGRLASLEAGPANAGQILYQVVSALVIGPAVSLMTFLGGPSWALMHWNRELTFVFAGSLLIFVCVLLWLKSGFREPDAGRPATSLLRFFGRKGDPRSTIPVVQMAKLPLTGLVMLSLAYSLPFVHYPPTATSGRLTSVHLAAAFGGALLFASLVSLFLAYATRRRLATAGIVLVAAYLSLLVAYRFSIQQDFVKAWRNEQMFWTGVIQQVPDMTDGTIILVSRAGLPSSHFIESNSWADPIMLDQIFRFPTEWQDPPRLFLVPSNWTKSVDREGDELLWRVPAATWDAHWEALPESNVVLLTLEDGRLVRQYGSIMIHRLPLRLKPLPSVPQSPWVHGSLYPLLISATE